jgi:hypothetical protein
LRSPGSAWFERQDASHSTRAPMMATAQAGAVVDEDG